MVFCGKPSKGCTHCRTRRIKCDQLDPACSQCLRAGKECPGYRDQLSLMFRDENEKVVTKSRAPKAKQDPRKRRRNLDRNTESSEPDSENGSPPTNSDEIIQHQRVQSELDTTLSADEGIQFFLTHYVTLGASYPKEDFGLGAPAMFPLITRSEAFFNAVSSVGYAGLSNVTNNPELMIVARRKYTASLRDITRALADVANSDLDATFKSVMLLVAFEIVTGSSPSLGVGASWGVHIDGGAAIARMLKQKSQKLMTEHRGWIQFVFAVYLKALSRGEETPVAMRDWVDSIRGDLLQNENIAVELLDLVARFTDLHGSIKQSPDVDSNSILVEAIVLDSQLEDWYSKLPDGWRFKPISAPFSMQFAYNGQTHEYQDMWIAKMLHNYRWVRILVNELLMVHMTRLGTFGSEYEEQHARSREIISTMATEICIGSSALHFQHKALHVAQKRVPAMSGIFMILFPLGVAGSAPGISEDLHLWVLQTLEYIGVNLGINQALAMMDLVRNKRAVCKSNNYASLVVTDLWTAEASVPP